MLTLPLPEGIRIPGAKPGKAYMVEHDLYNVVQRIKEVDPNLYVIFREERKRPFVVMEICRDGEHRMVSSYERLDASIVEDLQRMLRIPFSVRFKKTAAEVDAHNDSKSWKAQGYKGEFEELAEQFQRALYRTGMVHSRPYSQGYGPLGRGKKVAA
jgi:hypothetical protein